jgi:hypothetical protein
MKSEVSWLDSISDEQWNEIRKIARDLFDAGYFDNNQFKIGIMAFLLWSLEEDHPRQTEMPNTELH